MNEDKIDYLKKLDAFLLRNNCYKLFYKNLFNQMHEPNKDLVIGKLEKMNPREFIFRTIDWIKTDQGFKYWHLINRAWLVYLETLKKEESKSTETKGTHKMKTRPESQRYHFKDNTIHLTKLCLDAFSAGAAGFLCIEERCAYVGIIEIHWLDYDAQERISMMHRIIPDRAGIAGIYRVFIIPKEDIHYWFEQLKTVKHKMINKTRIFEEEIKRAREISSKERGKVEVLQIV